MRPEFLRDGKFYRSAVVTEIRARRLSGAAIERLADDPEMQAEFHGDVTPYIRPKKEWNEAYLEQISCVACEECFSLEYLLYLDKVTDYVAKAPIRKLTTFGIAGALLVLAGIIVWTLARK